MKKLVGIIGYPISHSVSPAMHNAAFKILGLDWEYLPFEVKPEDLEKKVAELREKGLIGFNVTIPHKEAIIPLLDEVTKLPKIIGAVNTVKNEGGKLVGYNTDGAGFIESLKTDASFKAAGKKAVMLGAGGAAKAVAVMLASEGIKELVITDIDLEKAEALTDYVGSYFDVSVMCAKQKSDELKRALKEADLIINATPIGMHPKEDKCPIDEKTEIGKQTTVFDLVYNPPETKLMKLAKEKGARAFNGLGMLVRQGAIAFTIWTQKPAPVDVMWKAAKETLGIK